MCEHSSACVSNPYDEGSFYCDCTDAGYSDTVAGLYCEFVATSYCNQQQSVSRTAFCVNNGKCIAEVSGSQAFPGCQCPTGYTGPVSGDNSFILLQRVYFKKGDSVSHSEFTTMRWFEYSIVNMLASNPADIPTMVPPHLF
jgi:hypothetical protein